MKMIGKNIIPDTDNSKVNLIVAIVLMLIVVAFYMLDTI